MLALETRLETMAQQGVMVISGVWRDRGGGVSC